MLPSAPPASRHDDRLHDRPATLRDYRDLPEGAPYQLINGRLVMAPSPTRYHQDSSGELEFLLRQFVKEHDLGKVYDAPFDVQFDEENVFQPDIVFVSHERSSILTRQGASGAPDLVIEILSPSTGHYDMGEKKRVYAAAGVREFWLVDPRAKHIDVLANENGTFQTHDEDDNEGEVGSSVLSGFRVQLGDVFPW